MRKSLTLLFFLAIAAIAATARAAPRIEDLHVTRQNGGILVSFQLLEAFDAEMLERVGSGLPTELAFTLRLERPRFFWFDRVFERATLQVVAMYNAVTREYLVNYKLDGRLIESRVVTDQAELERAMTLIHSLPAFELAPDTFGRAGPEGEPPPRVQLTVRARLGSKPFLLLFPNQIETDWARAWLGEPPEASPE